MSMKTKEKIDICMQQAELAFRMHNDRRQYEWKITLGFWASLLTIIVKQSDIPSGVIYTLPVLAFFYGVLWLGPLYIANENNKNWYEHFYKLAAQLLQHPRSTITSPPGKQSDLKLSDLKRSFAFLSDWALRFQFIVTFILTIIACLVKMFELTGVGPHQVYIFLTCGTCQRF